MVTSIRLPPEDRGDAPFDPAPGTARRLAAAADRAQRPAGAADRAHRLDAAGRSGGRPACRAPGAAELSAPADGQGLAAAAVVPGLGSGHRRGVVGTSVVPALRGLGTAGPRAGSLDHQPLPRRPGAGGAGRAAVRGGGAAAGRAGGVGPAGHAGGRDLGGRAGAPPPGRRVRRREPQRPGRGLGPAGPPRPLSGTRCTWAWTPTRNWSAARG